MSEILKNTMLAQAALLEVEGAIKSVEAATLRGDKAGAEIARQKAHDMLDSHMDLKAAAIVSVLTDGAG